MKWTTIFVFIDV